jgi:hypothetical protein
VTLADALGLSESWERALVRTLQAAIAGLVVYGLVRSKFAVAINGGAALAVTALPALVRREYGYRMDAGLVLWITVAVLLHTVGMLGFYRRVGWYDQVTHTVSATVVAGVGYAVFRTFEEHSGEVDAPADFRAVFVVVFVLAVGVLWEVLEFGVGPLSRALGVEAPLVVYGVDDIVTDFVFNAVGALVVALWGTDRFADLVGLFARGFGDASEK